MNDRKNEIGMASGKFTIMDADSFWPFLPLMRELNMDFLVEPTYDLTIIKNKIDYPNRQGDYQAPSTRAECIVVLGVIEYFQ
ncbi:MAG: hypothetical protein OXF60_06430 [Gammaproteobacteria bacterium]|nr:hypothetical protein [Gammaproteobacteria bacterium]